MPSATEVDLDRSSIDDNVRSGTYDAPLPATAPAEQTTAARATATKVLKFSPSLEVHGDSGEEGAVPLDDGAGRIAGDDGAPPPRASSPMPNAGGNNGKGGGTAAVTPGLKTKEMMRFIDGKDDAAPSPGEAEGGDGCAGDKQTKPAKKKTAAVGVSPGDSDKKKKKKKSEPAAEPAKAEAKKPRNTLQNYFGKAGAGGAKKAGGAPSRKASKFAKAKTTVHPPAPQKSKPPAKSAKSKKKRTSDAAAGKESSEPPAADQSGKSTAARQVKLVIPPADYPELVNVLEETTVIMRRARSKSIAEAESSVEAGPAADVEEDGPAGASPPADSAGPAGAKSGNDGADAEQSKSDSEGSEGASPLVETAPAGPAEADDDRDGARPAESPSPAGGGSDNDVVLAEPSKADAEAAAEDDSDDSPMSDADKPQRDPIVATANVPAGSVEVEEKSVSLDEGEDEKTIAMEEEDDDGTVEMQIDPSKKSAPPADDDRTAEESSDEMEAEAEVEAAPIPAEIETSAAPADGNDDVAMDGADEMNAKSPPVEEQSGEKDGPAQDLPEPEAQEGAKASSEGAPKAREKPQGKKKKDPNAPKGARSAFMYYKAANRDALKALHPDAKATEINSLLGKHWKELDKGEKEPYQEQAKADKERHARETAEYNSRAGADGPPAEEPAAKTTLSAKKSKQGAARGIASLASSFKKQEVTCPKRTRASPAGKPVPAAPKPAAEKPSSTPAKSPKPEQPRAVLSGESAAKLAEHSSRRDRWVRKAAELASRPGTEELEEENLRFEEAKLPDVERGSVEVDDGRFPDALLTHLLVLVQGR